MTVVEPILGIRRFIVKNLVSIFIAALFRSGSALVSASSDLLPASDDLIKNARRTCDEKEVFYIRLPHKGILPNSEIIRFPDYMSRKAAVSS
jgi:hypothetical protein